jgi:hypothetical protein
VNRPSRIEIVPLAVIAVSFLIAPTPGDGGCFTQTAKDLDPGKFFPAKQDLDCQKCLSCKFDTKTCLAACGPILVATFPDGCFPTERDGVVCLDALQLTGCDGYQSFVADEGSTVPTECDFCPLRTTP